VGIFQEAETVGQDVVVGTQAGARWDGGRWLSLTDEIERGLGQRDGEHPVWDELRGSRAGEAAALRQRQRDGSHMLVVKIIRAP
jgi:hypothetical protein